MKAIFSWLCIRVQWWDLVTDIINLRGSHDLLKLLCTTSDTKGKKLKKRKK